jgi:hypothetical protein
VCDASDCRTAVCRHRACQPARNDLIRIKARFADLGGVPMPMMPAEFGKLIVDETEKWAKVIRSADIRAAD